MMRNTLFIVLLFFGLSAGHLHAQESRSLKPAATEYAYGTHPDQKLDFYPLAGKPLPPLLVFIHGGAWVVGDKAIGTRNKPAFYHQLGFAFASVNYRLLPKFRSKESPALSPADQANDVAFAIGFLRSKAAQLGFDPDRIVLMGHSAGAHLAALVSTNPSYLDTAGVPMHVVKGAILLDGAGYDVNRHMDEMNSAARKGGLAKRIYETAFGTDPTVRSALSPATHVKQPNVASWLILHVADRSDSRSQSEAFGNALNANGSATQVLAVPDSTHRSVNQDAGDAETFVGKAIAMFLANLK